MSTSGTSLHEETAQEITLLKEQVPEVMSMMQQLVVGGGQNPLAIVNEVPKVRMKISPY